MQRGSSTYKAKAANLFDGTYNHASLIVNSGSTSYQMTVANFTSKRDFGSNDWVIINRGSTSYKMKATNAQKQLMALMPAGWTQLQVTPNSYLYDVAYGAINTTDSYGDQNHRYVVTAKGDATGTNFFHSSDCLLYTSDAADE